MRWRLATTLAVLLCAILNGPRDAAQAQAGSTPVFEPLPNWTLERNGTPSGGAEVLYSREAGAFLVVAPDLPAPVMLSARTRQVTTVQSLKLAPLVSGGYELLPNAAAAESGSFERDADGRVRFSVGGESALLVQRPWLLGFQNPRHIRDVNTQYDKRTDQYVPDAEAVEALKGVGPGVRIDVYFGEWCPHCAEIVPRILRVQQDLGDGGPGFRYYGLPQSMSDDPVTRRLGIKRVPTGVVYRNDEEIGRLYGAPIQRPETALVNVLGL